MLKKSVTVLIVIALLATVFLVVDQAQARQCWPGHHGSYGCIDAPEKPQPEPKPTTTPTPTPTQWSPAPPYRPTATPNYCSIRGCY